MLSLIIRVGHKVELRDEANKLIGCIQVVDSSRTKARLGFDLPRSIQVIREDAVRRELRGEVRTIVAQKGTAS